MKVQNAKNLMIAMVVLLSGGMAFLTAMVTAPAMSDDLDLIDKIRGAETEVRAQYDNRKNLLASLNDAESSLKTVDSLKGQFVPKGSDLDFITSIEDIAGKEDVEEKLVLANESGKPKVEELDRRFDLSLTGTFPSAVKALVEIEKMPFITVIGSFVIRSSKPDSGAAPIVALGVSGNYASPPKGL